MRDVTGAILHIEFYCLKLSYLAVYKAHLFGLLMALFECAPYT